MSSKFRLMSVLMVATLMIVAGCSIIAFRANAQTQPLYRVLLRQRHQNGACVNVGMIEVDRVPYALPATLMLSVGGHSLAAPLPSGCEFAMWEVEGAVDVSQGNSWTLNVQGEGTVRLVNRGTGCCGVGGVVAETNAFTILTPYLVAVGLIATTAAVAVKKRRN